MEAAPILAWTFVSECPIPDDLGQILIEGEKPWAAYKTFRRQRHLHEQAPHRPGRSGAHGQEGGEVLLAVLSHPHVVI